MAGYYTGFANNKTEFFNGVQAAAVAEGWTLIYRGADTGGGTISNFRTDVLWLRKDTFYAGMVAETAFDATFGYKLYAMGALGYSASASYWTQPGYSDIVCTHANFPCRKWHVFAGATYVYAIIETVAGHYRHCGFGILDKNGVYDGGKFLYGQFSYGYPYYYHYCPFHNDAMYSNAGYSTFAFSWRANGPAQGEFFVRCSEARCHGGLTGDVNSITKAISYSNSSNQFNRQAVLVPIYPTVQRVDGFYCMVGTPPNIRSVNLGLVNDEQEIILGEDVWQCFPIGIRTTQQAQYSSGTNALAFLKSNG